MGYQRAIYQMKTIGTLALGLLLLVGCTQTPAPQTRSDYDELSQLVLWERQARVRHLYDELAQTYWPDATVTTSWISSSVADFAKAGAAQNHRAEASANEVIINRSSAPIIHQHGNRAYVELPTEANHWITVNGEPAIWTSYMRLIYRCEKRDNVWKIADMTSVFESTVTSKVTGFPESSSFIVYGSGN